MPEYPWDWCAGALAEFAQIGSGEALPKSHQGGPYLLMGANGAIGTAKKYNFEKGYLVGRVGAAGAVTDVAAECWASDNTLTVKPKPAVMDQRYLGYLLRKLSLSELATRSAQPLVTQTQLGARFCSVPKDHYEQETIAQILDTLDTQIRQTEALIAKLERIKQGLLTDLLTRGIDQNGQLRPTPDQAPHLYKDSPLGRIPKDWEIRALGDVSDNITDGTHQAVKTVPPSGNTVPFLYVSCVRNGKILWDKAAAITNSDYLEIAKGRVPNKGMVLYTAVGSYGHAAVTSTDQSFAFQRHIACIYPANETVRPNFIGSFLNSEIIRAYADRVALGNAQKTVTLGELSNFPILLPPSSEQDQITRMLTEQDCVIDRERWLLKKLQITKTGLMDDLLTGRVRVTPLLKAAEHAKD